MPCARGSFPGEGVSTSLPPHGKRPPLPLESQSCCLFTVSTGNCSVRGDSLSSGFCLWGIRCKPSEMFYKVWTWDGQWTPVPKPRVPSAICTDQDAPWVTQVRCQQGFPRWNPAHPPNWTSPESVCWGLVCFWGTRLTPVVKEWTKCCPKWCRTHPGLEPVPRRLCTGGSCSIFRRDSPPLPTPIRVEPPCAVVFGSPMDTSGNLMLSV